MSGRLALLTALAMGVLAVGMAAALEHLRRSGDIPEFGAFVIGFKIALTIMLILGCGALIASVREDAN